MEFLSDGVLNPDWINELYQRDPNSLKIRAYFISGTKIKEDIQCENTNCILPKRTAENIDPVTQNNVYEPMIFCYFCNRIYHMKCKKLDLKLLSSEETPWTCHECRLNLHNGSVQVFWNKTKFMSPILDRRHLFMRDSAISLEQDSFNEDQQFDSQDFEAFKDFFSDLTLSEKNSAHQEIINAKAMARREKERAQTLQNALELEKENSRKQMDKFAQQMQQMQEQLARLSINQQSTSSSSQNHPSTSQQQFTQIDTAVSKSISEKLRDIYTSEAITPPQIEKTSFVYNPSPPPTIQDQQAPTLTIQPSNERLSESTLAQILLRFTESQERNEIRENLAHRRKVMPKMRTFDGDSSKWLEFEQDVTRYTKACQYDDETVRWHMKDSLKGDAFESVRDIIDTHPLNDIMETLRSDFGDPMIMVRKKGKLIKDLRIGAVLYREDAVKLRQAIQGYFSACNYAKTGYINSNELGEGIYNQLSIEDRARCKELFRTKNPGMSVTICLKTIYEYLVDRMPILDEKPNKKVEKDEKKDDKNPKPFQMFSTSLSSGKKDDSFKYEIRDRNTAPYIGYDLTKVNALNKRCEICGNTNHFAVQCNQFRAMTNSQKLNSVNDRNICKNCLLSSDHSTLECDKKLCCGYRIKNTRCQQKHHITLHNVMSDSNNNGNNSPRRSNTNYNTNRVQALMQNANQNQQNGGQAENPAGNAQNNVPANNQQQNQPQNNQNAVAFHAIQPRVFNIMPHQTQVIQLQHHMVVNHQKTVKMFKTNFIGPNGTTTCYSVGDSGAEITLVRDDLREQLGIKGTPELLSLQWTDNTVKQSIAVKFDLAIQGVLERSERIILKDCYAINDLDLPFRTLDMQTLKEKYPYLRDVEFEGYHNEQPVMLIGSSHAYAIESIKGFIGGGVGDPVAIESILGISVYGGNYDNPSTAAVNTQSTATELAEEPSRDDKVTNDELHRQLIEFNSIESFEIKAAEPHLIEDDKKVVENNEVHMNVLESAAIEVPLVQNSVDKQIPQIDINYAHASTRQLESYPVDRKALLNDQVAKDKELQQLHAFKDKQGLIRINSRSSYGQQRFVPVLPRKNDLIHVLLEFLYYKFRHIAIEPQLDWQFILPGSPISMRLVTVKINSKIFASIFASLNFIFVSVCLKIQTKAHLICKINFTTMNLRINVNLNAASSRKVIKPSQFGEIMTVQLENISNRHKLSEILRAFVTDFKTIVGAIRVADYNHKLLDSVVFLQFHDRNEAQLMLDIQSQYLLGQLVKFSNPHTVQGRVPFSFTYNADDDGPSNGIPVPMAVFNLNSKAESNTTIHLIKVLESFEFQASITSCRFAFDHRRHIIRNMANLTFMNRSDTLKAQQTEHWIIGNKLELKVPKSFPVLLHNSLAGLLTNGIAEFSSTVRDNNFYHANIADPTRPKHPVPTTLEVSQFPNIADIPLPPEPEPVAQSNSRQVLDEAFAIANIGQEIDRLNSDYFVNTPPQSPVLSIGGNEDFDELDKEVSSSKRRRLN